MPNTLPVPPAALSDVDLPAEIDRLRTLLERQPSCLMRVAADGTLLAVNDSALSLLGTRSLAQVLETNFLDRLATPSPFELWADFVQRVTAGRSASVECEMFDADGSRRAIVLQGVDMPNHPDGVTSLLVTVRDVSTTRRLEDSLREQQQVWARNTTAADGTSELRRLTGELERVESEHQELRAALTATIEQRHQIATALKQLTTALNKMMDGASLAQLLLDRHDRP